MKKLRHKLFETGVGFAKEHGVEVELRTTVEVRNFMFLGHEIHTVGLSGNRGTFVVRCTRK